MFVFNTAKQYNKYYTGEEKSTYSLKFPNIIFQNKVILSKLLKNLRKQDKIKILDFGCGNGRHLYFLLKKVQKLQNKKAVEIICYEISVTGLKTCQSILIKNNFKIISNQKTSDTYKTKKGYCLTKLKKGNIVVKLIHGYEYDNVRNLTNLIGKVDITLCLFGVLSHIHKNRKDYLLLFKNITTQYIFISVPSGNTYKEEQICYKVIRNQQELYPGIEVLKEGDIFVCKNINDKNRVSYYYHIYTKERLKKELEEAGLLNNEIGIICTKKLAPLTRNQILGIYDYIKAKIYSKILPDKCFDKAGFIYSVSKVSKT